MLGHLIETSSSLTRAYLPSDFRQRNFDQRAKQLLAFPPAQVPETLRLLKSQLQARHFEILSTNPIQELAKLFTNRPAGISGGHLVGQIP